MYSNEDITAGWTSNAIIGGTSVASLILFSDCQRKADNTVVRESRPGDACWCWITISWTVQGHTTSLIHCLVFRDASDNRWPYKIKAKLMALKS